MYNGSTLPAQGKALQCVMEQFGLMVRVEGKGEVKHIVPWLLPKSLGEDNEEAVNELWPDKPTGMRPRRLCDIV